MASPHNYVFARRDAIRDAYSCSPGAKAIFASAETTRVANNNDNPMGDRAEIAPSTRGQKGDK